MGTLGLLAIVMGMGKWEWTNEMVNENGMEPKVVLWLWLIGGNGPCSPAHGMEELD